MYGAVAQRIERSFNGRGGRGFESYQRRAHQVAPRVVTWGYFFVSVNMSVTLRNILPMLEFILLFIFFYLVINRFTHRKANRKPRTLDGELRALINEHNTNTGIALDIKRYLLDIINDNNNDVEKFSDSRINQAQHLLDRAGPAAFYWMGEIAAQLALLSAAQINGIPTNVNAELRDGATPESIVDIVVKS